MFYERIVIRPAPGKAAEVRALLGDSVRSNQPRLRITLTERVLGLGESFIVGTFHDSLEAYEKERDSRRADSAFQALASQISTLVSQPRDAQLYASISSPSNGGGTTRFTHLVRFKAARDKEAEVQAALEEFVEERKAEGSLRPTILRRLISMDGPTFVIVNRYQKLTEYENIALQRPPSIQKVIAKTNDIIIEPTAHALFEVIVPFPQ